MMLTNHDGNEPFSARAALIGMLFGAVFALAFVAIGRPGLIGVGAALGMSISLSLGARDR
jgi:hypothetical protein